MKTYLGAAIFLALSASPLLAQDIAAGTDLIVAAHTHARVSNEALAHSRDRLADFADDLRALDSACRKHGRRAHVRVWFPFPSGRRGTLRHRWAIERANDLFTNSPRPVLMTALAMPAFQVTASGKFNKAEDISVIFLDRYGNEVGSRGIRHNDAIPLEDFPDHLIKAVLATEDRRFYDHFGIDVPGLFRAMLTNARAGGVVQGGSSLSQQLAKNLFLSNERTVERKVKEAFLALWLEARLSKKEILSLYFDRAYMGGGAFGVQASRREFSAIGAEAFVPGSRSRDTGAFWIGERGFGPVEATRVFAEQLLRRGRHPDELADAVSRAVEARPEDCIARATDFDTSVFNFTVAK